MIGTHPFDKSTDLLLEIEALSRALSLPTSYNPKPKSTPSSSSQKKPSFWKWKPLKALSHIRQRRFDCVFTLHVHSIENLPTALRDAVLTVSWKRTSGPSCSAASTSSVHAFDGFAEFEETLTHRCSVYGTRKKSNHSAAKYEARHFIIYASLPDAPEMNLGKQMVDVTRLLPLTLEELEDPENRSGKWSTTFRLSGKGKGASLNVSFGFLLIDERTIVDTLILNMHDNGSVVRARNKGRRWTRSQSVEDVRVLHEILPSLKPNTSSLTDTVEELEISNSEFGEMCDLQVSSKTESDDLSEVDEVIKPKPQALAGHVKGPYSGEPEFVMIEQAVEISVKDQVSTSFFEKIDVEGLDQGSHIVSKDVEESCYNTCEYNESKLLPDDKQTAMKDKDLVLDVLSLGEAERLEALNSETMTPIPKSHTEAKFDSDDGGIQINNFSFDDSTESIASEFLSMLGINHNPLGLNSESDEKSPRELLWKQFEEETSGAGSLLFGLDVEMELDDELSMEHNLSDKYEDLDLSRMVLEAEKELHEATQSLCYYSRAKLPEDAEIEALMRKSGLNEKGFQCSPPGSNMSFGSPIDIPSELPLKLPPLGENSGPFVQTKDGSFLRSMRPALFKNSKSNSSLIMQVSSPVVVPAEMGSGVMEILPASVGIEKLSLQTKKLMPLEDVTGKTMQKIEWETTSALDACKRQDDPQDMYREADVLIYQKAYGSRKNEGILNLASPSASDRESEYVSVEDLAPLAVDKIEALSMEGLRIQSGMSDEEAPSNISSHFIGNVIALEGKESDNDSLLGLEGTAGLKLLDVKGNADDVDGLMSLSKTLDEWMRLDSGIDINEDQSSYRTTIILAAHRASSSNFITGGWKQEKTREKSSGRIWGLLGGNFTVTLMAQLWDPLHHYDPVGTPILALGQVERIFVPPKPKIYITLSEKASSEEDDESEPKTDNRSEPILVNGKKKAEEEAIPQFKITELHAVGLKTKLNKKNIWSNLMHHQSGLRWLLANGMGKGNKHTFMKSKPVSKPSSATTTVYPGVALWSISSQVDGTGCKWKEILAIDPHIRNPNVNFP